MGRNGDSDLRWSCFFGTFVSLELTHTIFFKMSMLLLSRLSLVGIYFMFAWLCRLSSFFFPPAGLEVTVSFNGALRASQKYFTCIEKVFSGC